MIKAKKGLGRMSRDWEELGFAGWIKVDETRRCNYHVAWNLKHFQNWPCHSRVSRGNQVNRFFCQSNHICGCVGQYKKNKLPFLQVLKIHANKITKYGEIDFEVIFVFIFYHCIYWAHLQYTISWGLVW